MDFSTALPSGSVVPTRPALLPLASGVCNRRATIGLMRPTSRVTESAKRVAPLGFTKQVACGDVDRFHDIGLSERDQLGGFDCASRTARCMARNVHWGNLHQCAVEPAQTCG